MKSLTPVLLSAALLLTLGFGCVKPSHSKDNGPFVVIEKNAVKPPHKDPTPGPPPPHASAEDQSIDQALAQLGSGHLAYSVPKTMKTGDQAMVRVRIAGSQVSIQTLESGIDDIGKATVGLADTATSLHMKVELESNDFSLEALSSPDQVVKGPSPTAWEWRITPLHAGVGHVHIQATVQLGDSTRDYAAVDRDIAVQISAVNEVQTFIEGNWKWIVATLGAIIASAIKFYQLRSGRSSNPPVPG